MKRWLVLLFVLLMPLRATATLPDCFDAVCKVHCAVGAKKASLGTGFAFHALPDRLLVMTNAHVVGRKLGPVQCRFYLDGRAGKLVPGEVVWMEYNKTRDMAVVQVLREDLGNTVPKVVPLAENVAAQSPVIQIGCRGGNWPTAVETALVETDGQRLCFVPSPADGRSGSPIFNQEGTEVLGLITSRSYDSTEGYAIAAPEIRRALAGVPCSDIQSADCDNSCRRGDRGGPFTPWTGVMPLPIPFGGTQAQAPPADSAELTQALNALVQTQKQLAAALTRMVISQEGEKQGPAIAEAQGQLAPLHEKLSAGDWQGAREELTSPSFAKWAGYSLSAVLISALGITGLGALGIRLGVPFALQVVSGMLRSRKQTAVDDIAEQLISRANGQKGNSSEDSA